jgi:hypothetical protein
MADAAYISITRQAAGSIEGFNRPRSGYRKRVTVSSHETMLETVLPYRWRSTMTPFGPRQEPTERPASKGHPQNPNPAGQWAVAPQVGPQPVTESGLRLPRTVWWSLAIVAAIVLVVLLVGAVLAF